MSTLDRASLDAGYCIGAGNYFCALSSEECNGTFMSSRELETTPGAHGGDCKMSKSTQKTKIGQCGEDGECASVKELCDVPALFKMRSDDCRVKLDQRNDELTTYGSCDSGDFGNACFWSADACDDKEMFKIDSACTCDTVRVGGCRKKNDADNVHCAVNAQACDDLSEFVTVTDMTSIMDCYLCRPAPIDPTQPSAPPTVMPVASPVKTPSPVIPPTPQPVTPPTPQPQAIMGTPDRDMTNGENVMIPSTGESQAAQKTIGQLSSDSPDSGNMIGGIIGGIVGVAVLAAVVMLLVVRRNKKTTGGMTAGTAKPSADYV